MDNNNKQNNNNKNNENKKTHINYRAYMPWLLVDKTWQTSILWHMDPLGNRVEMPWIPVHQHWQRTILWQMDPPGKRVEMPWIPVYQHWQRTILWKMDPLGNRVEMPWIWVHQYWQRTILWQMDPPREESRDALNTSLPTLAENYTLTDGSPREEIRDALNTSLPTLAENYTLADGPPHHINWTQAWDINCYFEMKCTDCDILIFNCCHFAIDHLHKLSTLQYTVFFWDIPLHFLKTCFSLESGFLMFLELQKSLVVSFQGCWTQWQRFESSCDRSYRKINWQTYPHPKKNIQ